MDQAADGRRRAYGVRLVRGPFVRLAPHPDACTDDQSFLDYAARLRSKGVRLAADLFSGAGGLSLGLERAGFRVVLGADNDTESVETHRHHFGGLSLDWDLGEPARVAKVAALMKQAGITLLAGGPPCQPFSKAGRSKIRHRVRHGLRDPYDERRDLWRSFLEVVRVATPAAVVMENVPDMALDREMFILRTMVHELESLGYAVEERAVDTYRYGVPQFRQRLILVAVKDQRAFDWPSEAPDKVTVWNAIGDLPEVEGGWRPEGGADGWIDYDGPRTGFQKGLRDGVPAEEARRVFDHITRPVRKDDEAAFQGMTADTRYSELPTKYKRYRDDIFQDKYKRLDENDLSRTITAHIAKDGYWYIHPRQNRTLTVREAARLQTFPDWFRFAGPPTAAFRQVGNAVPPLFGEHLGTAVMASLDDPRPAGPPTSVIAAHVAEWFSDLRNRVVPWLAEAETRWQVISAELLLERVPVRHVRHLWPLLAEWRSPSDTLSAEADLREVAKWIGRQQRGDTVIEVASQVAGSPECLDDEEELRAVPGLPESVADIAALVVPTGGGENSEEPVLIGRGALRVAARVTGDTKVNRRNRLTDGRLAVARTVGFGPEARAAHLGLIELAASVCRPDRPLCTDCPLEDLCAESQADRLLR